jgi:hypothetical protein
MNMMKLQYFLTIVMVFGLLAGATVYAQDAIAPGDTVQGEINNSTAEYTFTAKAGETVVISLNSNTDGYDPVIELYDTSGTQVGRDDDGGGFPNSRLVFTAAADGTYTITVTSFLGTGTGAYTLSLETQTATALTYGTPVTTKMAGTETLFFTFSGTEGDVVDVYAVSETDEDTRLTLRAPDNTEIGNDDDGGADANPYIRRVVLPSTGIYQVELSPFSDAALSGNITVTVEETEMLTLDANPQTVTLGGENPESETFQFEGTAGTTYRLVVVLDSEETGDVSIFINQEDTFTTNSLNAFGTSRVTMDFAVEADGAVVVELSSFTFSETGTNVTVSLEPVE